MISERGEKENVLREIRLLIQTKSVYIYSYIKDYISKSSKIKFSGTSASSLTCYPRCLSFPTSTPSRSARSLWGRPSTFSQPLCKASNWLIWAWAFRTLWTVSCLAARPSTWSCPTSWGRPQCRGQRRGAEAEIIGQNNLLETPQVSLLKLQILLFLHTDFIKLNRLGYNICMYWTNFWLPTAHVQQNILKKKFIDHIFTFLFAPFASEFVNFLRHSESLNIRKISEIDDIFLR